MNRITKWALRSVALWAIAKALEMANQSLRQRQNDRKLRSQAQRAAALPRFKGHPTVYPADGDSHDEPSGSTAH